MFIFNILDKKSKKNTIIKNTKKRIVLMLVYILSLCGNVVQTVLLIRARRKIKNGLAIKVGFILIDESIWKYDQLYKLLSTSDYFEPLVYICPYLDSFGELHNEKISDLYLKMTSQGYICKVTNKADGNYLDLNKEGIDFIFFTSPWKITLKKYLIKNFIGKLTGYVHYGYQTSSLLTTSYNSAMMNLCWKYFVPSDIHYQYSKEYSVTGVKNVVVTGYPGLDALLDERQFPNRYRKNNKKLIIWAPHHSIGEVDNSLHYATFMDNYDFFIKLSEKYQNEVFFVFKPHPILISKLSAIWGAETAKAYYDKWIKSDIRSIETGSYVELFHESDALIHDSGAFVVEYLATRKPVMFLLNNQSVKNEFNSVGQEAIESHYQGLSEENIENFVTNVVLAQKDPLREKRLQFCKKFITPPNGISASQNIFNYITNQLKI